MDLEERVAAGDGCQVLSCPGTPSQSISNQDPNQPPPGIEGSQPQGGLDSQFDFQDSSLSPALHLLPAASGMEPSFTDLSLLQQTYAEFAPLRACPDFSIISQDASTHQDGGIASHPSYRIQTTVLSTESRSSYCTLSDHSFSPTNQYKLKKSPHPDKTPGTYDAAYRGSSSKKVDQLEGGAAEDRMFLRSQELLQREVDMQSPVPPPESFAKEARSTRPAAGGADVPPDQIKGAPGAEQSRALFIVSGGVNSTGSHDTWERINRDMLSSLHQPPASLGEEAEPGEVRASEGGPSSADRWASRNQKTSFLGFVPQSQSTPWGIMIPSGSRVQVGVGRALHTPSQVPALPSLSYVQKVDAWRAGQSIGLGLGGLSETISEPDPPIALTNKGSTATPMESSPPSGGGSLIKGDFSRSADATVPPPVSADHHCPALSEAGTLRERTLPPQTEEQRATEAMVEGDQGVSLVPASSRGGGEDSAVSSTAGMGLRGLLSDRINEISTGLPAASSAPLLWEDMSALVQVEARKLQASSVPPSTTAADPWRMGTRSHSEPTLSLKELRQSYAGQNPPTPSLHPSYPSTTAPTCLSHHKAAGKAAGGSGVLCDAARRTEPEGCSAAPPKKVLTLQVSGPLSANTQQLSHQGGLPRDDEVSGQVEPPSLITPDADLLSDRSSDSSLTVRVAKLLQEDPGSTTLSSPPSTTEQDSRERNQEKVWAWCRQPLQLNEEDRRGVEEVKRQLLLKGEGSTDTGGSSDTGGAMAFNPADSYIGFSVAPPDNLFKPVPKGFPSTSPASPPSAEVSMATLSPSVKQHESVVNPEGGAASTKLTNTSGFAPPWRQSLTPLSQKRSETVVGQEKEPPLSLTGGFVCVTSSASDVSHGGGQSSAAGTQPVLTPKTFPHNLPAVGSAFRQLSVSSPDHGMGSSSPAGGWDLREQQIPESCRFEKGETAQFTSTTHGRGATTPPPLFEQTPAVPVLRPYKPPGSDELFYIPDREASSSPASTMESTHPGSDDAVPPPFSSDVLGQQDPGLEAGVTFRHTEGIYSKRVNSFNMQTGGLTAHSSPPKSQLPPFTNKRVLRGDQRTGLHHSPHLEQTQSMFQPDHAVHSLDLLWQRFCETLGGSGPVCNRDTSLVERLQRLSQLIHSMEGHKEEGLQKVTGTQRSRGERGGHDAEPKRKAGGSRADRGPIHLQAEEALQGEDSIQSLSSWSSSVVHTERSDTPSPRSDSSIDTQRLIRVYGASRVQKLKNGSGLGKLYAAIHRQKRGGTHRTDSPSAPPPPGSTEDRVSAHLLHRACSTSEGRSKSPQGGNLETVHSRTRPLTRDVGTTFPSPGDARGFGQTPSSLSTTVIGGGGSPPKFQTNPKRGRSRRTPPQSHPGGVSWFISADTLRSEERKENRPESAAWFQHWSRVEPWREPLRLRQVLQDRRQHQADPEPQPKTKSVTSTGGHISLQEALQMHRPDFILHSRQRMRRLALQAQERRLLNVGGAFCSQTGAPLRLRMPGGPLSRRAVPRQEMIQRSKRIYENLPEVQRRREEERRKAEYRSYRLNAQLYNKRVTARVLGRRSAWR